MAARDNGNGGQGGDNGNADRSQQLVRRQVGGEKGDLMWDISEGQRHIPFPIAVVPNDNRNPVLDKPPAK